MATNEEPARTPGVKIVRHRIGWTVSGCSLKRYVTALRAVSMVLGPFLRIDELSTPLIVERLKTELSRTGVVEVVS